MNNWQKENILLGFELNILKYCQAFFYEKLSSLWIFNKSRKPSLTYCNLIWWFAQHSWSSNIKKGLWNTLINLSVHLTFKQSFQEDFIIDIREILFKILGLNPQKFFHIFGEPLEKGIFQVHKSIRQKG